MNNQTPDTTEDDISLLDIVRFFIDNVSSIAASAAACATLGLAYVFFLPAKYEASASIQMAVVANTPVESADALTEKIKLPLYFSGKSINNCQQHGDVATTDSDDKGFSKRITSSVNKKAPIVNLRVQMPSPELASRCLNALIEDIRVKQDKLAEPLIKQKRTLQVTLNDKLKAAEGFIKAAEVFASSLSAQKPDFKLKDEKFSSTALWLSITISKENEIKELRNQIADLDVALSAPNTQPTSLAAPMYSPANPVGRSPVLIVLLAVMAGFFLGVLFVFARKAWVSVRSSMAEPQ
jgi:LPS O-antigen subunit length determinant protein (WzzB/FepE family)